MLKHCSFLYVDFSCYSKHRSNDWNIKPKFIKRALHLALFSFSKKLFVSRLPYYLSSWPILNVIYTFVGMQFLTLICVNKPKCLLFSIYLFTARTQSDFIDSSFTAVVLFVKFALKRIWDRWKLFARCWDIFLRAMNPNTSSTKSIVHITNCTDFSAGWEEVPLFTNKNSCRGHWSIKESIQNPASSGI